MSSTDVIIAGGGIIGLSTALELAGCGLRVTVLERERAMSEASWAAAGMLAAQDPENPPALQPLSNLSIALYLDYLDMIEHLSGLGIPLRTTGTLQGSARNHGLDGALSQAEIGSRFPELNPDGRSFLWLEEHSLNPRDLCAALPKAIAAAGIKLIEHSPALRVRNTPSGIEVATPQTTYFAGHFINCSGAWAGELAGLLPSIQPRKGQMVTVQLPPHRRLGCVIRTPELYLVPRGDGHVVIGATVERVGFDKSVEPAVIQSLLDAASRLWPPIHEAQIVESWAGLRPGSADGLPVIDACGDNNCWIAGGHFRNGILLAPATARVMRQLVLKETPSVDLSPFRCVRFAASSVSD